MKKLLLILLSSLLLTVFAQAQTKTVRVKSYTRKDGTTVKAHSRSAPSSSSKSKKSSKSSKSRKSKKKPGAVTLRRNDEKFYAAAWPAASASPVYFSTMVRSN